MLADLGTHPLPSVSQEVEKSGQLNVTKIALGGRKLR